MPEQKARESMFEKIRKIPAYVRKYRGADVSYYAGHPKKLSLMDSLSFWFIIEVKYDLPSLGVR